MGQNGTKRVQNGIKHTAWSQSADARMEPSVYRMELNTPLGSFIMDLRNHRWYSQK